MRIGLLGPLTVDGEIGAVGPRDRVVLAAMAVQRGGAVSADALADALWGDDPPPSAAKIIQGCVVRLRKQLAADAIETVPRGYRLAVPPDSIDAVRFERLVGKARGLLADGDADRAEYVIDEGLALWRGDALGELDGWDPGRIEATRLTELRLDAEELRTEARLRAGRHREAVAEATAAAEAAPLRERRWWLLALAEYQAGRQAEALATIRRARRILVDELGLDVGADLVRLEQAILRQDPSLLSTAAAPEPSPSCPYPGLVPYDIADEAAFFGREHEVLECRRRLAADGVLVVAGPSGCGKSSLVRAGVGAALRREGQRVVVITPGAHPIDALTGHPTGDGPPVLVVDQCEEVVTACRDADERSRFFAALADHAAAAPLVIAFRADRLGELAADPTFAALIERGLYLLRGMDERGMRSAIEGPARDAGLVLEPGLVDLLIRDVEGEPGALPLLSHALRETWERREGRTLTVEGYRATGGIRSAVAKSAEQVYEQASPALRPIFRDLLLRLVTPSPEGAPVRSRVPRRAVATDADHEQVIEQLVAARLVTSDEFSVELAHEALVRAWPRLRGWLDDDADGLRIWRHLSAAADAWDALGRPDSELYRGIRLGRAIEWRERAGTVLNDVERDFLDAGRREAAAEQQAAEVEARRQRRINRRLRVLVVGVVVLALVAAVGGLAARRQAQRADVEAAAARSFELSASALGALDDDPTLAKLLAVAAASEAEPDISATSALHRALAADLTTARYQATFEVGYMWADIDPAGARIVAAGTHPVDSSAWEIEVTDVADDKALWRVEVGNPATRPAFVGAPFFSADGAHVIGGVFWDPENIRRLPGFGTDDEPPPPDLVGAHVWDASTGEVVERIDIGPCGGVVHGASAEHLLVRTLHGPGTVVDDCRWADGTIAVELVDRRTGQRRLLSADVGGWLDGAAMSSDGRYVAYDDASSGEAVVLDVSSGDEAARIVSRGVRDLNGDGSLLLVGHEPIEVWDVATGELAASFAGHRGPTTFASFARFAPDGRTVWTTGADGALRRWDATTGRELFVYPGIGNGRLSFTSSGLVLVAQPDRDTATLLDTRLRGEVGATETCSGAVGPDSLSVAGAVAALNVVCDGADETTTFVVDLAGGAVVHAVAGGHGDGLAVAPDGARFVRQDTAGSGPRSLVVRDTSSGEVLVELAESSSDPARRLRWSPDGSMIAAAAADGVAVWDAASGELLHRDDAGGSFTVDVVFTLDSGQLIATSAEWLIRAISTSTWATETEREMFADGSYRLGLAGYTPDGSSLLTIGAFQANTAGALHWFDPVTLQPARSKVNVHEGSIRAVALDADGTRLATGSSDGVVRVWDTTSGDLVHEVPLGPLAVEGVGFAGDERLVVAVAGGDLVIVTTDPAELLELARASLTRGFSLPECARFNFGDDCPTLADLGAVAIADDDVLAGTYRIGWDVDDLAAELFASGEARGIPAPDEVPAAAIDLLGEYAGTYTMTFANGRFDVALDTMPETFCTGTYETRGDRVRMRAERGRCAEYLFLEATFDLSGDELTLSRDDLRGVFPLELVFASRPLERVR